MKFEPVTPYYAACEQGYRLVKHFDDGVPTYAAWHPQDKWLAFNLATAKEAAMVCREHWEKARD